MDVLLFHVLSATKLVPFVSYLRFRTNLVTVFVATREYEAAIELCDHCCENDHCLQKSMFPLLHVFTPICKLFYSTVFNNERWSALSLFFSERGSETQIPTGVNGGVNKTELLFDIESLSVISDQISYFNNFTYTCQ